MENLRTKGQIYRDYKNCQFGQHQRGTQKPLESERKTPSRQHFAPHQVLRLKINISYILIIHSLTQHQQYSQAIFIKFLEMLPTLQQKLPLYIYKRLSNHNKQDELATREVLQTVKESTRQDWVICHAKNIHQGRFQSATVVH